MRSEERRIVTSLANNYEDVDEVMGIYKTNAMTISPSESALFPTVCRANHSCVPNCNYVYNAAKGRQELLTTRKIRPGEELTVSYLPDNMVGGRRERRKILMSIHKFHCLCEICELEQGQELKQDEYFRMIAQRRIGNEYISCKCVCG